MNELEALYKSYNYAEDIGLVDKQDEFPVLLPVYHSKLRSNGGNIIKVRVNNNSTLYDASFLNEYKDEVSKKNKQSTYIIFPVSYDSASRSGKKAPSHPIVDKVKYIYNPDGTLIEEYNDNFIAWLEYEEDEDVRRFLETLYNFLIKPDSIDLIAKSLIDDKDYKRDGFVVDDGDTKLDIGDIFLEFELISFENEKDMNVSSYKKLHESFISYTKAKHPVNGICNISGENQYLTKKHRGLLGNAKLISISNHREAYVGRLKKESGSLNVGRETSDKIHLMLSYLLENKYSSVRISESQYLLTWFSEDVKNTYDIDITYSSNNVLSALFSSTDDAANKISPANQKTYRASQSFKLGKANYSPDSKFYCMIIDSFNPGRVVIKYFDELTVSDLDKRLKKWEEDNSWHKYKQDSAEFETYTPSIYTIFLNAYGVERLENNTYKLAYDNKKFMNNQYISMIESLLTGKSIPYNIEDKLAVNIRQRQRYKDLRTWNNLLFVARAVLNNKNGESFNRMIDKDNNDRSYLLGRLLSIYHTIEDITYNNEHRLTNAEKFWNNYLDRPMTTITILEKKTNTYLNKLKTSNYELYNKIVGVKNALFKQLTENYDINDNSFNAPVDYKFIFGYTAQNSSLYGLVKDYKEQEDDK